MPDKEFYYTIEKTGIAEFKDRGSRFIAFAYPILDTREFKDRLEVVKKDHPKATHHCYAYRLGINGNNFRVNDDGEPSGTAGRPILGQIDSKELTDILIIVVRYFEGTLLGVPGLINAYKTSASLVLQLVPVVQKSTEIRYTLEFDYTLMNTVISAIKKCNCSVVQQDLQLFCRYTIGVPVSRQSEFIDHMKEFHTIQVTRS